MVMQTFQRGSAALQRDKKVFFRKRLKHCRLIGTKGVKSTAKQDFLKRHKKIYSSKKVMIEINMYVVQKAPQNRDKICLSIRRGRAREQLVH